MIWASVAPRTSGVVVDVAVVPVDNEVGGCFIDADAVVAAAVVVLFFFAAFFDSDNRSALRVMNWSIWTKFCAFLGTATVDVDKWHKRPTAAVAEEDALRTDREAENAVIL